MVPTGSSTSVSPRLWFSSHRKGRWSRREVRRRELDRNSHGVGPSDAWRQKATPVDPDNHCPRLAPRPFERLRSARFKAAKRAKKQAKEKAKKKAGPIGSALSALVSTGQAGTGSRPSSAMRSELVTTVPQSHTSHGGPRVFRDIQTTRNHRGLQA